jgi:hypothetical protein
MNATIEEPILLDRNNEKISIEKSKIESDQNILNNIIESFEELEIGDIDTKEKLKSILYYPKATSDKMIMDSLPETAEFGGIKASKAKLFNLAMPDNLPQFIAKVESLRGIINNIDFNLFDFVNNRMSVKAGTFDKIERKHSVYVDTPERLEMYEAVMNFKESLENIKSVIDKFNKGRDHKLNKVAIHNETIVQTHKDNYKDKVFGDAYIDKAKLVWAIKMIQ